MKTMRLLQTFVSLLFALAFVATVQPALAQTGLISPEDAAVVVVRQLTYWDATFVGYVDSTIYEKWPFTLDATHRFTVTANSPSPDLVPLVLLLDASGNEIARATSTLTSTQPAGSYFVQIQPQTGGGFYELSLRQTDLEQPDVTTMVSPTTLNLGESAAVTVSLGNVPTEGYSSTEFTCTYDANLVEANTITAAGLFGVDPVVAMNGPQNGSFILAIAASDGHKATSSGTAFTFSLKALQVGQTAVECKARVSKGDNILTDIQSTAAALTVQGNASTATPTPTTSSIPPTATSTIAPTATSTIAPTATSTPTPQPPSTVSGQVVASKPVTVSLYNGDASLATSVIANHDGTFSLTAAAGSYTVVASASGFLGAQGAITLTNGESRTMQNVSLLAGDIDGNNVIDQYDALTIGMSYNGVSPAAADLNNDGIINVLDLELLAHNYRVGGALAWQ